MNPTDTKNTTTTDASMNRNNLTHTHHCRECGDEVTDACHEHPSAPIDSILVERAAVEDAPKHRTITLTGRAPIRIVEDDWPVIARSKDWDNQYEFQANRTWYLTVRQHEDGRTIVYGAYDSHYMSEPDLRAGETLEKPDAQGVEIAEAIRRVGEAIGASQAAVDSCIGDLPAEDIE